MRAIKLDLELEAVQLLIHAGSKPWGLWLPCHQELPCATIPVHSVILHQDASHDGDKSLES